KDADQLSGFQRYGDYISNANHNSFVLLKNVDLTGITKFIFDYSSENRNGILEARVDSQGGAVIASSPYKATGNWDKASAVTAKVTTPLSGKHDVYFFILKRDKPNNDIISLKSITFGE
ncbi:MAG TPA: carbohydrate-binding protein, partial [Cyclobacteriaceae bacterium]